MPNQIAFYPTSPTPVFSPGGIVFYPLPVSGMPSPIHFWPMTEGSGTTFIDNVGAINLTTSNIAWNTTPTGMGASSKVGGFNGTNAFAQASAVNASLNFSGVTPFTVSVWVFVAGGTGATLFGNLTAPTSYEGWEVSYASGVGTDLLLVNQVTSNQMTAATSATPSVAIAESLIITYDGSLTLAGVKTYVNGVSQPLIDQSGTLSSSFTSAVPFLVGKRADGTNLFQGDLAYMRVWNVKLTPVQVATFFALGPR